MLALKFGKSTIARGQRRVGSPTLPVLMPTDITQLTCRPARTIDACYLLPIETKFVPAGCDHHGEIVQSASHLRGGPTCPEFALPRHLLNPRGAAGDGCYGIGHVVDVDQRTSRGGFCGPSRGSGRSRR